MIHEVLGPCQVKFNGVDVGFTEGAVKFSYEGVFKEVKYDQTGDTVMNRISMGKKCEAAVPLADSTLATLAAVIAGAVNGTTKLSGFNSVGRDGRSNAKPLVLTRIKDNVPSTDPLDILTIPLATPGEKLDWGFGKDGQRVTAVNFVGLPSVASGATLGLIFHMGPLA